MSLIALPGTPEFEETVQTLKPLPAPPSSRVVAFAPKSTRPSASGDSDLQGKTLMLNLAVCRGFSCGGFQLSLNRNFAVVDANAQQGPIRQALADGRLVDITGQDPKTGFKTAHGAVSKVEQEDTGLRVFFGQTPTGERFITIPKTKTQLKAYERELKRTGTITLPETAPLETGLSGMTVEDVPVDSEGHLITQPVVSPKGTRRARTNRRQR